MKRIRQTAMGSSGLLRSIPYAFSRCVHLFRGGILAALLMLFASAMHGQINATETFDPVATPAGWTYTGFARSTITPCAGTASLRRNFWSSAQTGDIQTRTWTSTGLALAISFDYKITNFTGGGATPNAPAWGEFFVEVSTDGGATYGLTAGSITTSNHTPSTACANVSYIVPGASLPEGNVLRVRLRGQWASGDYYIYIDNVVLQQDGSCGGFQHPDNPCDDGDPNTFGDVLDATCSCVGSPLANPTPCGLNLVVPDNGCASNNYMEVQIPVTGEPDALGANVGLASVDLITTHTFNGDLRIFLVSPNGVQRELVNRRGSFGDNFGNLANCPNAVLTLQDGAAAPTGITGNNVTGTFAPEQTLAGFNDGSDPNGNWTIRICDAASGDVGALQYVALNFVPIVCLDPAATASTTDDCPGGQFTLNVNLTSLGSASSVTIATSVGDTLFNVMATGNYQFGAYAFGTPVGVALIHNDNATCNVGVGTFTSTGPACPLTNPSACGLNLGVPDNGCASNNYREVEIAVAGQPNALGTNVTIQSVDLITTHTFNGDLRIFLVSPNGVQRELVNRRGSFGDNFGNLANCPNAVLTLQDGAAAPTGITGNNVTGTFAPEQTLAGFNDGSDPNGVWTIRICDAASGDVGALQYVALNFLDCVAPMATASTTDDCPGSQFTLNVNLTSLGSASSVTIATSVGDTLFNAMATGNYQFGAYAFGTPVGVTLIHNDNATCNVGVGTFTSTGSACPLTNPSACGLNLGVPDNGCASNNYREVEIAVAGQPNALGTNVTLQSVDLISTHTFNGDLRIFLVSPNGVQRELVNRRGSFGDNFGNPANCPNAVLTLQDGAAAPTGITGNNVTGTFAPEQTLAGFNDASDPNGVWTIRICDAASGDVGALQYVALNFGCSPPQGAASVATDCGNGQFFLDVDVASLGQADTVRILADMVIVASLGGTGIVQIGPFVSGSTVNVTLQDADEATCTTVLAPINYTCPPPNDLCADAIPLDCDTQVFGTNVAATGTGQPSTFCGTAPGSFGVWYTFTGTGGFMTVSTCNPGTDFDTKLIVYRSSCANLACVSGNDDSQDPGCEVGGLNRKSKVTLATDAGETYFALVTGFGTLTGNFELTLEGCCDLAINGVATAPESCPGSADGGIILSASSSAGGISYAIAGPVNETNGTGQFTGIPPGDYLVTATDGIGCEATTNVTVEAGMDDEDPVINCPANQSRAVAADGCSYTVGAGDITVSGTDNCTAAEDLLYEWFISSTVPGATATPDEGTGASLEGVTFDVSGTASGAASFSVVYFVADEAGNFDFCLFNVFVEDTTSPVVACTAHAVVFNGEAAIALDTDDLVDADDNCGVASITLSPEEVSCDQLGQTIDVAVTVTDKNGNPSTCTSQVAVAGLPCGFSQDLNGINCNNGNSWGYNVATEVFTGTSTNCAYGSPYTKDQMAYVAIPLCGNGELIAQVTSISGAQGWAGIVMREDGEPVAKKVQLLANLNAFNRREVRTITGGASFPQTFTAQGRYWLRLLRQGNQFVGYTSANGAIWTQAFSTAVQMNTCIEAGLIITNPSNNSTVTATFANVQFIGSQNIGGGLPNAMQANAVQQGLSAYPNPTTGMVTLDMSSFMDQEATLLVQDGLGRTLRAERLGAIAHSTEQIDLSGLPGGVYYLRLRLEQDGEEHVQKIVVQPRR